MQTAQEDPHRVLVPSLAGLSVHRLMLGLRKGNEAECTFQSPLGDFVIPIAISAFKALNVFHTKTNHALDQTICRD